MPNEVGGNETCHLKQVAQKMKELLTHYHTTKNKTIEDIIDFHYKFEIVHPFQDGNGRVGRLIIFKECLANNIVPFIIDEQLELFYYRGLQE
ncbi:Fic family protein [Flavobacterium pectinovorum]|uniref:Fic family protein n=1 Tax=Flavobacterium pectinovorum TaxID=29533 RepID=UPI001F502C05|nr:Fic family protein [Flavobacterium pectinovorum]